MTLQLNSLIDHFTTTYTYTPSTLGNQLSGLEIEADRVQRESSDPMNVISDMISNGEVFRAVEVLREKGPPVDGKVGSVYPAISRVRDAFRLAGQQWSVGEVMCAVMYAYQEFGTRDPARGLACVYRRLNGVNPFAYPMPDGKIEDAHNSISISAELYADVLLALDRFVQRFNARSKMG